MSNRRRRVRLLFGFRAGEADDFGRAVGTRREGRGANAERTQGAYKVVHILRIESAADVEAFDRRIVDDQLPPVVPIELGNGLGERDAIKPQPALGPGQLTSHVLGWDLPDRQLASFDAAGFS